MLRKEVLAAKQMAGTCGNSAGLQTKLHRLVTFRSLYVLQGCCESRPCRRLLTSTARSIIEQHAERHEHSVRPYFIPLRVTSKRSSSEENLVDIRGAKRCAASRTLAVPVREVRLDALLAEHVPALGDDGVLLAHFAHGAAHERAHVLQLLLHFRADAVQARLPQLLQPHLQALHGNMRSVRSVEGLLADWGLDCT